MRRCNSIYFCTFIIFVQYFENVYADRLTVVDFSEIDVPDDVKILLLECQFKIMGLSREIDVVRTDLNKCQAKSMISKDESTTTETTKIIEEDQTESQIATTITLEDRTKTEIRTEIRTLPRKCTDATENVSGVYELTSYVDGALPIKVYCDFDTQGGGWTVIQKRINGAVNFNRYWVDYKNGFGDVSGEHWLGLDHIHNLTTNEPHELLIILEDFDNQTRWAKYDWFVVGNENEKYSINTIGSYSGNAGESFSAHLLDKFSTYDEDNDIWDTGHCAELYNSGWWFNSCAAANLNGPAIKGAFDKRPCCRGIFWLEFRGKQYSLKSSKMMIRPKSFGISN